MRLLFEMGWTHLSALGGVAEPDCALSLLTGHCLGVSEGIGCDQAVLLQVGRNTLLLRIQSL
jgi:hypothetical protein